MKTNTYFLYLNALIVFSISGMETTSVVTANKDYEQLLIDNIEQGNITAVKEIVEQNYVNDLNVVLKNIATPLMYAAMYGQESIVKYFLEEKHVKVDAKTSDGDTALIAAAIGGKSSIVKYLIEQKKADTTIVGNYGYTALYYAAREGKLDVVKYFVELPNFNIKVDGVVALSLAHSNKHKDVEEYLISKGVTALPMPVEISGINSIFYHADANKKCTLDSFELLAHHKISIASSGNIPSLAKDGVISIYQPRVFKQTNSPEDACTKEQLEKAVIKLGGTEKMHRDGNPIFGGTCGYHAIKNAFIGLMLLHDYDKLVEHCKKADEPACKRISHLISLDIQNLISLKSAEFDCEHFLEHLHSKIFRVKSDSLAASEYSQQAVNIEREHIMKGEIEYTLGKLLAQRHQIPQGLYDNLFSFIDTKAILNFLYDIGLDKFEMLYERKNGLIDILQQIQEFDVSQQIALFRTNNNYRHAFILALNTENLEGWGISSERMHAIAIIIDKRDTVVNVIICESNNHPPFAIKQIVFDFIDLFINDQKYPMDNAKRTMLAELNASGIWITEKQKGLPSFASLVTAYVQLHTKFTTTKNQNRNDIHLAMFLLSKIQHTYERAVQKRDHDKGEEEYLAITNILQLNNLLDQQKDKDVFREMEIALHSLLQEVETTELNIQLFRFIQKGDLANTKASVEMGADVNAHGNYTTPLGTASQNGHYEIVEYLLEKGAAINGRGRDGNTPLMLAAQHGHHKIIECLIKQGANVNAKNDKGFTALMYAAAQAQFLKDDKKVAIVKLLIEQGKADQNICDNDGNTVLAISALMPTIDIFKYLVTEHKMPVNLTTLINCITQETIQVPSYFGPILSEPLIDYLIRNHGLTMKEHPNLVIKLLIKACKPPAKNVIKRLLEKDCDAQIDAKDEKGWTALMHAMKYNDVNLFKFIIEECHADINVKNNDGQTVFGMAIQKGDTHIIDYFLKKPGFTIETSDQNGFTALLYAIAKSDLTVLKNLVEHYHPDILKTDNNGRTALMIAAGPHLTIEGKCKAEECSAAKDKILYWLPLSSHLDMVKYLITNGCDVNAIDKDGYTALMYAALADRADVVEYLIQKGADINKKNNDKRSALDLVRQAGNDAIIKFLENSQRK